MARKDYVTLTIAILALVVSAGTAYFNILRTEENFSVTVEFRGFAVRHEDKLLVPATETPIVFINSGNRPIVVRSFVFAYIQTQSAKERDLGTECQEEGVRFKTDLDPLVIKPNDVVVKLVKITGPLSNEDIKSNGVDFLIPVANENRAKFDFIIDVCAELLLTSPFSNYDRTTLIFEYQVMGERNLFFSYETLSRFQKPQTLIKKIGNNIRP